MKKTNITVPDKVLPDIILLLVNELDRVSTDNTALEHKLSDLEFTDYSHRQHIKSLEEDNKELRNKIELIEEKNNGVQESF